ncbi:Rpr2-domain-containing protein [Aulographum hederae CBS 113979]|uniref:Rpr2-domain-containing protein n=1 Tax=Aulographum hederae CBS 113979 TaxID=1176131 RepID=A0A6G1HF39_9PEZI|nr:Rpr2-domain-containing protein [Aulographum hederae CBS 113979]
MAKKPGVKNVPNKHIYARASYLYQAATYLASKQNSTATKSSTQDAPSSEAQQEKTQHNGPTSTIIPSHQSPHEEEENSTPTKIKPPGLPAQLLSQTRAVSRKGQARLSLDIKRSICKRCNSLLVSGSSSSDYLENKSNGGKKACADVWVVECVFCSAQKRFPVGGKKQMRKSKRVAVGLEGQETATETEKSTVGRGSLCGG